MNNDIKSEFPGPEASPVRENETDLRDLRGPSVTTVTDLRAAFIDFFAEKSHVHVPSAPLLPEGDGSLLFVNSGMVPFKDCFRGTETRDYSRAASIQKSLRVSGKHNDYDQIGRTARHHTFFEMLGNFSLGDYFKEDAIKFAWEFVKERLGLDIDKIWVTVHENDLEAAELWKRVTDISHDRIVVMGDETNLWAMGEFGPCGYSSELFFYLGDSPDEQSLEEFLKDDGTYVEFWNLVFMEKNKNPDGTTVPLPKPCIDTGSGLERLASIMQGVKSNFDTNEVRSLISHIEAISGRPYDGSSYDPESLSKEQWEADVAMRVIADHSRAIAFLIADGVEPSNEKEGYVLRRLIRRAAVRGSSLGIEEPFLAIMVDQVKDLMGESYPELFEHQERIHAVTDREEKRFKRTLSAGMSILNDAMSKLSEGGSLAGEVAFKLHDTYGFPFDLTCEILQENGFTTDEADFKRCMEEQRSRSRGDGSAKRGGKQSLKEIQLSSEPTVFVGYESLLGESAVEEAFLIPGDKNTLYVVTSESPFYAEKGGQIGDKGTLQISDLELDVFDVQVNHLGNIIHLCKHPGDDFAPESIVGSTARLTVDPELRRKIAKNHSGTHLLNAALREVLGDHISQKGSFVSADRLRFDFTHDGAISQQQLREIQEIINAKILQGAPVTTVELPIDEAKKRGAVAAFDEKYGDLVRVVEMGEGFSIELCGGTHVGTTQDIGMLLIVSEGSIASGVRRIEAITGETAIAEVHSWQDTLSKLSSSTKRPVAELPDAMAKLQERIAENERELRSSRALIASLLGESLAKQTSRVSRGEVVVQDLADGIEREQLRDLCSETLARIDKGAVVLGHKPSGTVVISLSGKFAESSHAGELAKEIISTHGGKGGGKQTFATVVNLPPEALQSALEQAKAALSS